MKRPPNAFGAIVIIPRVSLRKGGQYTVTVETGRHEYKWSFTVRLE